MNNGTFCSPGGGGHSGHARSRYSEDHFDKMIDGSFNNGGFQAQQTQMTGPDFSGPATGYRSQFQDQIQAQEVGLASSSDDERGSTRPTPGFEGPEFTSSPQYQVQGHYSQHHRCYPGSAMNKPSLTMHPLHPMTANSVGPGGNINQIHNSNFQTHRMHCGPVQNFPVQQMGMTPALNHMLQSSGSGISSKSSSSPINSPSSRDESIRNSSHPSKPEMASPPHSSYSMPHQIQQQCWGSQSRPGGHHYLYPQGPGSSPYRSQSGCNDMSQGRRPAVGAMGGSYPQQGGQYMSQQVPIGPGPQQRFMMGVPMQNQMYGHSPSQPQMYMSPSQQPPGPPVSPAARPLTPQLSQQMQNMVQNSPTQPSPVPSEHGSTQSAKHGDDVQDMMTDINNSEDPSGENSRGSTGVLRPAPSPVGSTGSRSNTPASIPGGQAGSPMPVRPPSSQIDGQSRMTQSPMATQGYNQHMMPPPNSMGYMPNTGKIGSNQMPGHYPQYSAQYPQGGNYGRQQPNMGGMSGPPMSGPMQNYPGSQPNMYPNGPGQMPGTPMYGNMPGMVRGMGQQGYGPNPGPYTQGNTNMGMMNNQYGGYNSHMGPLPGQHSMQQPPGGPGPMPASMSGQQGGMTPQQHSSSSNKAAQAAQAAMMAAASSIGPRMSHTRGSISPSRGMFGQSGGGPLAQMNNMTNSPNLGSPSLNSMSNAVEQLTRSSSSGLPSSYTGNVSTSIPSPVPKLAYSPAAMINSNNTSSSIAHSGDHNISQTSPISSAETHESLSRPSSTTAHHPDLPNNESTMGSDSSGGMPSDSTSVDSGFHSSDQGDKTSDSISNLTQPGSSPPLPGLSRNGETSRTLENISPPGHPSHPHQHVHQMHMQHEPQHYHMGSESKMPYSNDGGVPLPPSAISLMPSSSSSVVTTANAGPLLTSVTQSIASPVTSVSTSAPHHYPHPHPHHMGHLGGPPHMMGHSMGPGGPHGMMPNGMPPSGMMNAGQMGGHNQLPPNMVGPPHMMPPNMGGPNMNMNQNGPMMGPIRPVMGHSGPMMPGHPGMNSGGNSVGVPSMGHMQPQQQMNCMPHMGNNNNSSNSTPSDEPPEKKKKTKELEGLCAGSTGPHYSEEPNSPGALKSSTSDLSKLFEMGGEPDRRQFLERILAYLEESGQPITALPVISKTPLDLYKLYFCVREKGGFEEVTRSKKWRDVCTVVNIGTSASAAFTLKKNYIRYLFNYECKYDRGGINPAPILAQMEAQLAHKREQKNKRAPSPAGSNSNESFRPPSVPNNQMDSSYQPPNIPPPYMQNPDGNMPNPLMSGNMMMGPNMIGGSGPNSGMGSMMGGPPGMGPSGMIGGPGPNMMHGQQGMMPPNAGGGNMMGPHMMSGGPPGYGGPMMQHPGGPVSQPPSGSAVGAPVPSHSCVSTTGPVPATSDSISVQDPFADESGYLQQRGGPLQPALSPQSLPSAASSPMSSGYPGVQQSNMGSANMTSTSSRPASSSSGYGGPDQSIGGFPPNSSRLTDPPSTSADQFPFGQQFERPDRFDQSSPNMGMRPPGSTSVGMTPSQPPAPQAGENNTQIYPGPRFPGPHQSIGMRPQQGSETPGQYPPQGPVYQGQGGYPGPQYTNYSQTSTGPYPGPRPTPGPPGGMYGTPSKRFPDEHTAPNQFSDWPNSGLGGHMNYPSAPPERQAPSPDDRIRDGCQWSPMQRPRMSQSGPGYMSPAPPSTPPMGPYSRQISHRSSPQSRETARLSGQKMPPAYGGLPTPSLTKKEMTFPPGCVESASISTTKRKKLTSKDIAPFEPWRLMLSLKSGLLAESTWALDTLNILLYDDNTYGYFGLNTLPGLLEVLTEHFRHCLLQMFEEFEDLEAGLSQKHRNKKGLKHDSLLSMTSIALKENRVLDGESDIKKEKPSFNLTGTNYTMTSRKGLPVRIDQNPVDCSVLELKGWDVFSCFDSKPDYWSTGHGNITDHVLTHLESDNSNKFLSGWFRRKRTRPLDDTETASNNISHSEQKKQCMTDENITISEASDYDNKMCIEVCQVKVNGDVEKRQESVLSGNEHSEIANCEVKPDLGSHKPVSEISVSETNHSNMCNSDRMCEEKGSTNSDSVNIKSEQVDVTESNVQKIADEQKEHSKSKDSEKREEEVDNCNVEKDVEVNSLAKCDEKNEKDVERIGAEVGLKNTDNSKPLENGDIDEPKLSPMVNHLGSDTSPPSVSEITNRSEAPSKKTNEAENDNCSNSSPPVLKAECLDSDEDVGDGESMNSTVNNSWTEHSVEAKVSVDERRETGMNSNTAQVEERLNVGQALSDNSIEAIKISSSDGSCVSETEELSASIVTELMRQDENTEEEAFQRDDPPLCVTPDSRDELGRRCVCISNIIRSLSCVPGNEARICRHPGIMRVLGRLLLLHHSHPTKPPPRKLTCGDDEEEREEPPRVYDDEHWWWDYLDQLRENTLVTLANICGHLKLGNSSEQVCYPLLEGLLHWVICPASVARDPLPTLPSGSVLSPQRLVLEALCKLCIHEINVDLLLATRPVKRLLELFSVLVHLLADRNHQITREFSIVLLSLLVTGESSAARAIALQHPSVSLLVDFLEVAEQNALAIANQQGLDVLQSNPEVMGTSLDMLRRAASILLHMARVPDNRKMFMRQQSRLLNLVMSQILDQSVSNTLSEVLFECSQFS